MRHDSVVLKPGPRATQCGLKHGRVGRLRFSPWTRGRIASLLAAAIGLPWLPTLVGPPEGPPMQRASGHSGAQLWGFALSSDGQTIAAANSLGTVTLRSAARGWDIDRSLHIHGAVLAFSPDGRSLLVGEPRRHVVSCDLVDGGRARPLEIPVREASDMKFSPDGRTLAVSSYRSCEIILWDFETGRPRTTLQGHSSPVAAMAFAPDGRSLVSAANSERAILLWDLDTGRPRHVLTGPGTIALAFSPDSRLLATVNIGRQGVRIWDAETGHQLRRIAHDSFYLLSVAFSPDGRLLATGSGDGTASLWSVATGRALLRLDGQADLLSHVAFLPDGRTLIATANDDDIRLWDLDGLLVEKRRP
jgi:WD40 repeat protein